MKKKNILDKASKSCVLVYCQPADRDLIELKRNSFNNAIIVAFDDLLCQSYTSVWQWLLDNFLTEEIKYQRNRNYVLQSDVSNTMDWNCEQGWKFEDNGAAYIKSERMRFQMSYWYYELIQRFSCFLILRLAFGRHFSYYNTPTGFFFFLYFIFFPLL